ncbi:MAG: hypothetical protein EBZ69_07885 [Alphaproteobacteria bacterium]|nr:hypothetical protein [Alphaproteobacteria bacterium]NDC96391.1 hypothetical protein [bacterium]
MRFTQTLTADGNSNIIRLDHMINPFNVAVFVDASGGGSGTDKVQVSGSDPLAATDTAGTGMAWWDHATLTGLSAGGVGNIAFPVTAVRLVRSSTSGSRTSVMTVIQAGPLGR